jgi:hypothetical protein
MDPNLVVQSAQDIRHIDLLETALPSKTSRAIIEAMLSTLTNIRLGQSEFIDSSNEAAPAATARAFLSGATILKLPQQATWKLAYNKDPETKLMIEMIKNPLLIKKENLNDIHFIYRQPMRDNQILLVDDIIYIREKTDIAEISYSYRLSLRSYETLSSQRSTLIPSVNISIYTTRSIKCGYDTSGPECGNTSTT